MPPKRARTDWGIGRPAPGLDLPDGEDRRHALADYAGRPILVSFLSHAA